MKILALIITLIISIGCHKEILPSPCKLPDCSDTIKLKDNTLGLMWQKPLRWDKEYTPAVYITDLGDEVVFNYDLIEQSKLYFINKIDTTGRRFYEPIRGTVKRQFYHSLVGLIAYDYKSIYTGNSAASMHKIASVPEGQQFSANGELIGDKLFIFVRDDLNKVSFIYKFDINDGRLSIDRQIKDSDCPECEQIITEVPDLQVSAKNDSFLVYYKYFTKGHGNGSWLTEVFLSKNETKTKVWESTENSMTCYGDGRMYGDYFIQVSTPITAINIYTGDVVWQKYNNIAAGKFRDITNGIFTGNKLNLISLGRFYIINADDGKVEYESDVIYSSSTESKLTYFDGVIYWTASDGGASKLYGMRLSDRKLVLRMSSPNYGKKPYYNDTNYDKNGLIIDTATRLAYTADGFFAQCFKIPENFGK